MSSGRNDSTVSRRQLLIGASALGIYSADNIFGLPNRCLAHDLTTAKSLINGFDAFRRQTFAFINFFKVFRDKTPSFEQAAFQQQINVDGYPIGAIAVDYGSGITCPGEPFVAPNVVWVLKWSGKGGGILDNGGAGFVVTSDPGGFAGGTGSSSTVLRCSGEMAGTSNQIEFINNAGAVRLNWQFSSTVPYDGTMRDLRLYRKSDEKAFNAGAIFTPEFLQLLRGLNPKILRTMDWSRTNNSNVANFSNRCPVTAFSYLMGKWWTEGVTALWAGRATGNGDYICMNPNASGSGGYVQGETVQLLFANTNSASPPTLNVGGRGAVTIKDLSGAPLLPGEIKANSPCTLVYDLWLNTWLLSAEGRAGSIGALGSGVPVEMQVALCNELNVNFWFNVPIMYTDASVISVASYIRDNLNPNLTAYFELSNECWNEDFNQTKLCQLRGGYLGLPKKDGRQEYGYYGLRVRQVMSLVTGAWSPRPTATLRRVMAVQETGSPATIKRFQMDGADLSTSFGYQKYDMAINAGHNDGYPRFSRPIDICDVLSYAAYFNGALINDGNSYHDYSDVDMSMLVRAANDYASSAEEGVASALAFVDNDIRQGTTKTTIVSGTANNSIQTTPNPFANGDVVMLTVIAGGSLPAGLPKVGPYFVVDRTRNAIRLATEPGGRPLRFKGGSGLLVGLLGRVTLQWHLNFLFGTQPRGGWEAIAASYDGTRPEDFSNIAVECYEGGLQSIAPTAAQCEAIGIPRAYGGPSGLIENMLTGYKNSRLGYQFAIDCFTAFLNFRHSKTPAWFELQGPSQWSLMPGSTFTQPFQTYYGNAAFNR